MYYKCCVPGCNMSKKNTKLHKFPQCEKRLQKWLRLINCDRLKLKSAKAIRGLQVCHKHFEKRFVTQKSRILGTAYPTLFSEYEILCGTPSTLLKDPEDSSSNIEDKDHRYARKIHYDHNYSKDNLQISHSACNEMLLEEVKSVPPSNRKLEDFSTAECQQNTSSEVLPSTPTTPITYYCIAVGQQNISSEEVIPSVLEEFSVTEGQQNISLEALASSPTTTTYYCIPVDQQNISSEEVIPTELEEVSVTEGQQNISSEALPSTPKRSMEQCMTTGPQDISSEVVIPTESEESNRITEGQQNISPVALPSTPKRSMEQCMTTGPQDISSEVVIPTALEEFLVPKGQQNISSGALLPAPTRKHDSTEGQQTVQSGSGAIELKKKTKGRVIKSFKNLPPQYKDLYKKYKNSQKTLNLMRRAKKASDCKNVCKKLPKLNPIAKTIFTMQLRLCTLEKNQRKFTDDEKVFFLSLFKQGPDAYRYLSKVLILPSEATLKRFVATYMSHRI